MGQAADQSKRRFSLAAAELKEIQLAEKRGELARSQRWSRSLRTSDGVRAGFCDASRLAMSLAGRSPSEIEAANRGCKFAVRE